MIPPPALVAALGEASVVLKPLFVVISQIYAVLDTVYLNRAQLTAAVELAEMYIDLMNNATDDNEIEQAASHLLVVLIDVKVFAFNFGQTNIWRQLVSYNENARLIAGFFRRMDSCCQHFQLNLQLQIKDRVQEIERKLNDDVVEFGANVKKVYLSKQTLDQVKQPDSAVEIMNGIRKLPVEDHDVFARDSLTQVLATLQEHGGFDRPLNTRLIKETDVFQGELLGTSAIYQTFKGEWEGSPVAIKRFLDTVSQSVFTGEMLIWSNLHHPNILELYGATEGPKSRLAVMPYCSKGNILEYTRTHPNADRLQLIAEIAAGLAYLHKKRIIHGELRASSVMVDALGKAKISNFGLSVMKNETFSAKDLAQVENSLRWLSPERLRRGKMNMEADIYAFGVAAFEILTGERPWVGFNDEDVKDAILCGETLELPKSLSLPADIHELITSCWNPAPSKRPRAAELSRRTQCCLLGGSTDVDMPIKLTSAETRCVALLHELSRLYAASGDAVAAKQHLEEALKVEIGELRL